MNKISNKSKNNKKLKILNHEFPPLGGGASPVSYKAKGYAELGNRRIYKEPITDNTNRTTGSITMIPGNQMVAGCFIFAGEYYNG